MLSPYSTPVLPKLSNHYTQSPLRKILPFPKCCQLSNFYSLSPCQVHRKWTLKKVTPRNDLSPLLSKAVCGSPIKVLHNMPHTCYLCRHCPPSRSRAPARKEHQFKLLFHSAEGLAHSCLSGMGKCIQVSSDFGNTACSDAGDYLYLAYNPNFRNCFSMLTCIDSLQIAQASVWFS